DLTTRMHALTYSTPVTKIQYLGGKFFAALAVNLVILLGIPIGIMLAIYSPGVDAATIGPFHAKAYLTAFAYIILPNAFFATAIQFSLASWTGRAMAAYVGSILLFFLGFFVAAFILFKRGLGTVIDPIGIRFIVEDLSHLWTTSERNFRYLTLDGTLLINRMLWASAGVLFLIITYFQFQLEHRTSWNFIWFRKKDLADGSKTTFNDTSAISIPKVKRTYGFILHSSQILRIAWESFRAIAFSKPGLALLILIPLLTIPVVLDQMISDSVPIVPTTTHVLRELTAPLSAELSRWVIIPLLIIFFAGELVWRERENRLGEITQTLPGSEWAPLLGKFIGLVLVLCAFTALQMAGGMAAQLIDGYDSFEIGLYIKVLFGLQLTDYVLFALLVIVIHVIVDHKYIGHMAALVAYAFIALSPLFGVEHNLLVFTGSPEWSYTDMRGFGNTLGPWMWFKLYWAAWALLFAVAAKVLWVRGKENSFRLRLRMARQRFTRATSVTAVVAIALIVLTGGFIFYNTNIQNSYYTTDESKERQALYEKRYGQYRNAAQPHLSAVTLSVDIFPETSEVKIEGSYRLINKNSVAIDSIHIAAPANVTTYNIGFDRTATLAVEDQDLHHIIYKLDEALKPGDSIQLNFRLDVKPEGFRESGINVSIADNGTNFGSGAFPAIGYQSSRELIMPA
ncbi:MAG TPA: ABC transporter permease, partial [Chryseosolibacter sp.]